MHRTWLSFTVFDRIRWWLLTRVIWPWNQRRVEVNTAMGGCERCGSFWRLREHRSNSAYNDDTLNGPFRFCQLCAEEDDAYWASMWDEYNRSRL